MGLPRPRLVIPRLTPGAFMGTVIKARSVSDGIARRRTRTIPRLTPGAFMGTVIKARSVSDGIAPSMARDPPASAGGFES